MFGATGPGRRNFGDGSRESCWAKLARYPRALGRSSGLPEREVRCGCASWAAVGGASS